MKLDTLIIRILASRSLAITTLTRQELHKCAKLVQDISDPHLPDSLLSAKAWLGNKAQLFQVSGAEGNALTEL